MSKNRLNLKTDLPLKGSLSIKSLGGGKIALTDLADSLDDQMADAAVTQIDRSSISVPSPWASFLTFNNMFFNGAEKLGKIKLDTARKKALDEWRCLVILTALKPILNLDIEYEDINLESLSLEGEVAKFANNLLAVAPKNSLFMNKESWNVIRLIKLHGCVIGAFSNTSLFCSTPNNLNRSVLDYMRDNQYPKSLEEIVFTYMSNDGKKIEKKYAKFNCNDLIKEIFGKSYVRCHYFIEWTKVVSNILAGLNNKIDAKNAENRKVKDNYIEIINNLKALREDVEANAEANNLRNEINNLYLGEESFVSFNRAFYDTDKYKRVQDVFDGIRPVLNFTLPYIYNKIKVLDLDVVTFNNLDKSLQVLTENKDIEIKLPRNTVVLSEKDIFNDTISVFHILKSEQSKHLDCYYEANGLCDCPVAPIKQTAMEKYFAKNPYVLSNNAKNKVIEYEGSDSAVTVTLALETEEIASNAHKKVVFEKKYFSENIIKIGVNDIPIVSVWPYVNILHTENNSESEENSGKVNSIWHRYFVYMCQGAQRSKYQFNCNIQKPASFNRMSIANNFDVNEDESNKRKRSIKAYNSIPKYFYLIDTNINKERGVLILNKPPEVQVNKVTADSLSVGFDFGTTSSTAFLKYGTGENPQLSFVEFGKFFTYDVTSGNTAKKVYVNDKIPSGLEKILLNSKIGGDANSDFGVFFPGDDFYNRMAYPSLFAETNDSGSSPFSLLQNGSAILSYSYNNLPMGGTVIDDNMKWSKNGNLDKKIKSIGGYLTQMLTSVALYVLMNKKYLGTINLYLSYPTALSESSIITYKQSISSAIRYINQIVLKNSGMSYNEVPVYKTESVAAAMNFMDSRSPLYACIDIGGGSSDISAWYKSGGGKGIENIMQTSVNIASRTIFRPAFAEFILTSSLNPAQPSDIQKTILSYMGNKEAQDFRKILTSSVNLYKKGGEDGSVERIQAVEKVAEKVEAILFEHSETLTDFMTGQGGQAKFTRKILFGLYSILSFTIYSIASASGMKEFKSTDLTIYLAGNGSKLYSWIINYLDKLEKAVTRLAIDNYVIESGGWRVKIQRPDFATLKTEAAKGLLLINSDIKTSASELESNEKVYNGEYISYVRADGERDEFYSDENLTSKDDEKFDRLESFYTDSGLGDPKRYVKAELSSEHMNEIKNLVDKYNEAVGIQDLKISVNGRFWNNVFTLAQDILNENLTSKQLSSTLMVYVKAVIENI